MNIITLSFIIWQTNYVRTMNIIYDLTNELRTNDERYLAINISIDEPHHLSP